MNTSQKLKLLDAIEGKAGELVSRARASDSAQARNYTSQLCERKMAAWEKAEVEFRALVQALRDEIGGQA